MVQLQAVEKENSSEGPLLLGRHGWRDPPTSRGLCSAGRITRHTELLRRQRAEGWGQRAEGRGQNAEEPAAWPRVLGRAFHPASPWCPRKPLSLGRARAQLRGARLCCRFRRRGREQREAARGGIPPPEGGLHLPQGLSQAYLNFQSPGWPTNIGV